MAGRVDREYREYEGCIAKASWLIPLRHGRAGESLERERNSPRSPILFTAGLGRAFRQVSLREIGGSLFACSASLAYTSINEKNTVEPPLSDHSKCQDIVVAYGRWSEKYIFQYFEMHGLSSLGCFRNWPYGKGRYNLKQKGVQLDTIITIWNYWPLVDISSCKTLSSPLEKTTSIFDPLPARSIILFHPNKPTNPNPPTPSPATPSRVHRPRSPPARRAATRHGAT